VRVEIAWLKALAAEPGIHRDAALFRRDVAALDAAGGRRSRRGRRGVKAIEAETNHDVKAVEYWMKERFAGNAEVRAPRSSSTSPAPRRTSTTSHALMLPRGARAPCCCRRSTPLLARLRDSRTARRPADALAHPRPAGHARPRSARKWPTSWRA
jgi:adenylosuccinate lyase